MSPIVSTKENPIGKCEWAVERVIRNPNQANTRKAAVDCNQNMSRLFERRMP